MGTQADDGTAFVICMGSHGVTRFLSPLFSSAQPSMERDHLADISLSLFPSVIFTKTLVYTHSNPNRCYW